MQQLNVIDNIKVMMMVVVVLYHSCLFFTGNWFDSVKPEFDAKYLVILAQWLNTFHVQTFTMASGFLFFFLRIDKNKYKDFNIDVKKRAVRLLLPYYCVMVTWVIPFFIAYNGFSIKTIIFKYVLGCAPSQLWFLPMLFWLFVLFYRFMILKNVTTRWMIIIALVSLGGAFLMKLVLTFFKLRQL